jgi:hypothetical protein
MKLFKRDNDYCLYNELGETIAVSWANATGKKLSKENCDEIFGVVDDVDIAIGKAMNYGDTWNKPETFTDSQKGYLHGFVDCLEMNEGKIFTINDVKKVIELAQSESFTCEANGEDKKCYCRNSVHCQYKHFISDDEIIQSLLKPTEIEVEIVTEPMNLDEIREQGKGFLNTNTDKPKFDSNGNLILKKL